MAFTAKWSDFSNLDSEHLIAVANERLPKWVVLALVVAIAWQLAQIVWMLVPASASGDPIATPATQSDAASPAAASDQANVRMIAGAHLFGEASADTIEPAALSSDIEALPDARVSLSLKGTLAARDPGASYAIIASSTDEKARPAPLASGARADR